MNSAKLGTIDGEDYYLKAPSWDCSWYVGFGYVSSINSFQHLSGMLEEVAPQKNMYDQMIALFGDSMNPIIKNDLWKFCELFKSWETLKEAYELYNRGGSHYTYIKDMSLKSYGTAHHILSDLFKVVNAICDMLSLNKLNFNERVQKDLYMNMYPTTFHKNPAYKGKSSGVKEWILNYINIYDDPKNHKDAICPKSVKELWTKQQKQNQDAVNHNRFTALFEADTKC